MPPINLFDRALGGDAVFEGERAVNAWFTGER
jgi:hypothetical protein